MLQKQVIFDKKLYFMFLKLLAPLYEYAPVPIHSL